MIKLNNLETFKSITSSNAEDVVGLSVTGISTDSRLYAKGNAFVAITGVRYNAFEFIEAIMADGCKIIFFTSSFDNNALANSYKVKFPEVLFIALSDSILFLQELAADHRARLGSLNDHLSVISISGSNGKTTCKDILNYLCEVLGENQVVATRKNDNNHIGVPLTLLRMNEDTKVAIIELGSNHPGEIPLLVKLVKPDHAYVTNIGHTHLEFFPTLNDVLMEESSPLLHLRSGATGWLNIDDDHLKSLANDKLTKVGIKNKDFKVSNDELTVDGVAIKNPHLLGSYNYHNLGVMILIAKEVVVENYHTEIIRRATSFIPGNMRSEWIDFDEKKVFLDAYNANPSSMVLAVSAFSEHLEGNSISPSKTLYVLGDMLELGNSSAALHTKTSQELSKIDIENIIFIGEFSELYKKGWGKKCAVYQNLDDFMKNREKHFKGMDYIFLKASRSLKFESILT